MSNSDRVTAGCVVGTTQVIPEGSTTTSPISAINVVNDFVLDFSTGQPIWKKVGGSPIADVKKIKSLKGTYVYPAVRVKFTTVDSDVNYPLLSIKVKIPNNGETPTVDDCIEDAPGTPDVLGSAGEKCKRITCSLLHPFKKYDGNIIPAYCVEEGNDIFVDPQDPLKPVREPIGKVISVSLVPPEDVYGLYVTDKDTARATYEATPQLIPQVNEALEEYWQQNIKRYIKLNLPPSRVEANDFACSTYNTLLDIALGTSGFNRPPKYRGLESEEFLIITELIATGSLDVQKGYHFDAKKGFVLNDLIPPLS
jgi:hypothetical protein